MDADLPRGADRHGDEDSYAPRRRRRSGDGSGQEVEPRLLDVDGVATALIGTIAWAMGLVLVLVFYDTLREQGRDWWLWTCLAGLGLGLIGFEYCRRVRIRRRAADAHPPAGGRRSRE